MVKRTYGRNFWRQSFERAVKTAAQAVVLLVGGDQFDVLQANVERGFGFAAGGFLLSLITSIATAPIGEPDDPSAVRQTNP